MEVLCWRPWRQGYLQLSTRVLLNHLLKPSYLGMKEEYGTERKGGVEIRAASSSLQHVIGGSLHPRS